MSNCVRRRIRSLFMMATLGLALGVSVLQAESARTIEDFVNQRTKWASLEGATLRLEGRYSIFSKSQLRFVKCELEFVLAREFLSPAGDSRTIEVTGRIEKRENKLLFVVSEMQVQPSDVDRLKSLRSKVGANKADEYYKVAAWGESRAAFYEDPQLLAEAHEAFRLGVQTEYRIATKVTPELLRGLKSKLATRDLAVPMQQEYEHEALWLEFDTFRKTDKGGDSELATRLLALPGAKVPLLAEELPWSEHYLAKPLLTYKEADDPLRQKCHRAFYMEVMRNRIQRQLLPDGSNGYDIADRLEKQVPEFASQGEIYRSQEQAYHLGRVTLMTRKELTELQAIFEVRGLPAYLTEIKQKWIAGREQQMDTKSVAAWIELGDDFANLLMSRNEAIRCYVKAYELSPQTEAIATWLTDQGLALHNGRWIPKNDVPRMPVSPLEIAVQQGQVREKMTAAQVRAALGVEPTSKTKVATGQHIQEWWLFEEHGLSIQFIRRRRPEEAIVSRVINLNAGPQKPKPFERPRPSGTEAF